MTDAGITVIGEGSRVNVYAMVGAQVRVVEAADDIRSAWQDLSPDDLVVLTAAVADVLLQSNVDIRARLVVVMP